MFAGFSAALLFALLAGFVDAGADDVLADAEFAGELDLGFSAVVAGEELVAGHADLGTGGAQAAGRVKRQAIFEAELPPRYLAVIDEAVFRRPTGSRAVMVDQIGHLLTQAENDRIDVQVVPLETRMHPGMDGAFRLIKAPEVGEILWLETRVKGGPVEDPAALAVHTSLYADLLGVALPADASCALLERIKGELT